jgi:D-sedoheptulose 7-phosphate isomerase
MTADKEHQSYWVQYQKMYSKAAQSVSSSAFDSAVDILKRAFTDNDRVFVCGNGGSAAIAEHFSCDFLKGIQQNSTLQPNVISLPSNVAVMTAIGNDIGYDYVFSKQLELYRAGVDRNDVLVVISSSGNSNNIVEAVLYAEEIGMPVIALVGFNGGRVKDLATVTLHVHMNQYGIVEDVHQSIMHALMHTIKRQTCNPGKPVVL